jgi:hypothetical protein
VRTPYSITQDDSNPPYSITRNATFYNKVVSLSCYTSLFGAFVVDYGLFYDTLRCLLIFVL